MAGSGDLAPLQGTRHGFTAPASLSRQGTASSLPQRFPHARPAPGPRQPRAVPCGLSLCWDSVCTVLSLVCVCAP